MRKEEQKLWDRFRTNINARNEKLMLRSGRAKLSRIESPITPGFPDVVCLRRSITSLVEMKARVDIPARPTTGVFVGDRGLSTDQANYLKDWHALEGRAAVLCSAGDIHFLIPGSYGDQFNKMTLNELKLASSFWGQSTQFWNAMFDWLAGGPL